VLLQTRRLERLSPGALQRIAEYRAKWGRISAETSPADRSVVTRSVIEAYRAAGLAEPEVVWCAGPLELASRCREMRRGTLGPSVRREVYDQPLAKVISCAESRVSLGVRHAVINGTRSSAPGAQTVNEVVYAAVDDSAPSLWSRLRRGWRTGGFYRFRDSGWSYPDYAWLAACDYFISLCPEVIEVPGIEPVLAIAAGSGWVVPFAHVCWIGERPATIRRDDRGRLHSREGPALQYRDGLTIYMWKGVQVPDWMIEHPDLITTAFIDRHPDFLLRRCMIEIMTPEKYIANSGAVPVARDETGILWRKQWWNNDAWAAVEVVNGTPEPNGVYKHYFLQVPPNVRSAREAVAWTYGMTESEYARLQVRT
jgi:hypothetical protein